MENLKNHRGDRSEEKKKRQPRVGWGNIFRNRSVGVQLTGNIFLRLKSEKVFNRGAVARETLVEKQPAIRNE